MALRAGDVRPDPGGVQSAIDRYRDLAKYLITIFAGVGALLIAGTQLASIGKLSFKDEPSRVIAIIAGLVLAVGAVVAAVGLALKVLRPVEMTFNQVVGDAKLRAKIEARTWLLSGARSLDEVRDNLTATTLTESDRETWFGVADDIVAHGAYLQTRETFEGTWWSMLVAGVLGALGIIAFTWGANPPDDSTRSPVVEPAPVSVRVSLTAAGREALTDALGSNECASGPIEALVIGGTATAPKVVTLPNASCRTAQFVLSADWGAATRPG